MTMETIKNKGEYLGYCEQKGHIYSVCNGLNEQGKMRYTIVAVLLGDIQYLITYSI